MPVIESSLGHIRLRYVLELIVDVWLHERDEEIAAADDAIGDAIDPVVAANCQEGRADEQREDALAHRRLD